MNYKRKERYIIVIDDWYPCYEGNKVKLILSLNTFKKKLLC